jgi:hypothetical protein
VVHEDSFKDIYAKFFPHGSEYAISPWIFLHQPLITDPAQKASCFGPMKEAEPLPKRRITLTENKTMGNV